MGLVNGLRRTNIQQLRRAVRCADNHRNIALMRFHDGTVEVRCCSSRSTKKNRWGLCGKPDSQRSKGGAAFIMEEVHTNLGPRSKGHS
jgi:hypothetical protein